MSHLFLPGPPDGSACTIGTVPAPRQRHHQLHRFCTRFPWSPLTGRHRGDQAQKPPNSFPNPVRSERQLYAPGSPGAAPGPHVHERADYPQEGYKLLSTQQRLEFRAWSLVAQAEMTLDIRYPRLEVSGLTAFRLYGTRPGFTLMRLPRPLVAGTPDIVPSAGSVSRTGDLAIEARINGESVQTDLKQIVRDFSGRVLATDASSPLISLEGHPEAPQFCPWDLQTMPMEIWVRPFCSSKPQTIPAQRAHPRHASRDQGLKGARPLTVFQPAASQTAAPRKDAKRSASSRNFGYCPL